MYVIWYSLNCQIFIGVFDTDSVFLFERSVCFLKCYVWIFWYVFCGFSIDSSNCRNVLMGSKFALFYCFSWLDRWFSSQCVSELATPTVPNWLILLGLNHPLLLKFYPKNHIFNGNKIVILCPKSLHLLDFLTFLKLFSIYYCVILISVIWCSYKEERLAVQYWLLAQ